MQWASTMWEAQAEHTQGSSWKRQLPREGGLCPPGHSVAALPRLPHLLRLPLIVAKRSHMFFSDPAICAALQ